MIRIILFTALFALSASVLTVPSSSALAAEGKGFLGFFNRSKNTTDGTAPASDPVHMTPGISGTSNDDGSQAINLGKKAVMARYEDSDVYKPNVAAQKAFDDWNKNEAAKANASTRDLMAQVAALNKYNAEAARQKQAQKIAKVGRGISAGIPPAQANPAMVQSYVNAIRQQAMAGATVQPPVGAPPPAPKAKRVEDEKKPAATTKPKRERKSTSFFNRIEE